MLGVRVKRTISKRIVCPTQSVYAVDDLVGAGTVCTVNGVYSATQVRVRRIDGRSRGAVARKGTTAELPPTGQHNVALRRK